MPKKDPRIGLSDIIVSAFSKLSIAILHFLIFIGDFVTLFFKNLLYLFFVITHNIGSLIIAFYTKISIKSNKIWQNMSRHKFKPIVRPALPSIDTNKYPKVYYFLIGFLSAITIFLTYYVILFFTFLPDPSLIGTVNFPVSTQIVDRKGRLLYEVYRDKNRIPVKIKDLPVYIGQATVAIEDKDFYNHKGISFWSGIVRAIKESIITQNLQGGSTITQQLVKSALLSSEKTLERKTKEIILAVSTERKFTKHQILEMYLNQVPYGGTAYGIEQASQIFFEKSARELTLPEAAYLAGLTRAPSVYSAYINPTLAKKRRDEVLRKMYEQKYISKKDFDSAIKSPVALAQIKETIKAPHFVFYVKQLLEQTYGIKAVETRGFKVQTTLDLDVQEAAEEILREELDKITHLRVGNGALLVTKPDTGEILAMVGSKDFFDDKIGAFNVTIAQRQPGSSIKPLMYSLALERQYTASSIIEDAPVSYSIPGSPVYRPVNYDGRFHGRVTLRSALANSYNIPAVKTLNSLGVADFIDHAKKLGITTWNNPDRYGLSLTLGGGEVKMIDMAASFGVFANGGKKVAVSPISAIYDYEGRPIEIANKSQKRQVISAGNAFIISDILSDSQARRQAFGQNSALEIPGFKVAVKTGTTNAKHDNWTIGYTPKVLVAVWVGNNDNSPMDPRLTSGITGAAPIWNRVMTHLLKTNAFSQMGSGLSESAPTNFAIPDDIVVKQCLSRREYYIKGTENNTLCTPIP